MERPRIEAASISTFKISNDQEFAEKLEAIIGLYISPPENAIVFSCDEKSQIQALDRTQPGLPMRKGRAATMTHDYKRHGTTNLVCGIEHPDRVLVAHNMSGFVARDLSGFVARDLSGFIHSFILRVCDEAGRVATGTKTHAI